MPSTIVASQIRLNNIATQIVSEALTETLTKLKIEADDLTNYYVDANEELVYCGINTMLINNLSNELSTQVNNRIKQMPVEKIYIPMGKLFDEGLFSNFGPKVELKIKPSGVVGINYDHSFTSVGINQVNYRVWLRVELEMQVFITSNIETVQVTQDVVIVDQVINGKVPDSYVNVPDTDSMLNVIQ